MRHQLGTLAKGMVVMVRTTILAMAVVVIGLGSVAWPQRRLESLPEKQLVKIGMVLAGVSNKLIEPPIKFELEEEKCVGLGILGVGIVVALPDKKFNTSKVAIGSKAPIPFGQLFLYQFSLIKNGNPVPKKSVRVVTFTSSAGEKFKFRLFDLVIALTDKRNPLLLIYGKGPKPLSQLQLNRSDKKFQKILTLESGESTPNTTDIPVTITFTGIYHAEILVRAESGAL